MREEGEETGREVRGNRGKIEREGASKRVREKGRKAAGKLLAGRGINERQCY